MNNHISSRWLVALPNTEVSNLSVVSSAITTCNLPGFDFLGGDILAGGGGILPDLKPDRFVPEPLNITFLVDEKLENYLEVLKQSFSVFGDTDDRSYFDFTLTPLDTLGQQFGLVFRFIRTRILSVNAIDFDNNASERYQTCSMSLKYESLQVTLNGSTIINLEELP